MPKRRDGWKKRGNDEKLGMAIIDPTGTGRIRPRPEETAVRIHRYNSPFPPRRERNRVYSIRRQDRERLRKSIAQLLKDKRFRFSLGVKKIKVTTGWRDIEKAGKLERVSYIILKDEKGNRLTHGQVRKLAKKLEEIQ